MYSYAPKISCISVNVPKDMQSTFPFEVATIRYPYLIADNGEQVRPTNKEWSQILTSEGAI